MKICKMCLNERYLDDNDRVMITHCKFCVKDIKKIGKGIKLPM